MNLKRYRVNNIQEALQLIKKDLGPNAVIVSTRQVKEGKGTFGLFGKTILEVTAGLDEKKAAAAKTAAVNATVTRSMSTYGENSAAQETTFAAPIPAMRAPVEKTTSSSIDETRKLLKPLQQEIQNLKNVVENINSHSTAYENHVSNELKHELGEMRHMLHMLASRTGSQDDLDLPEHLMVLYQQMKFSGLEDKFAKRLILETQRNITDDDLENFSYVKIFLARMLMKIVKTTNGIENINTPQKIVALIGPTGVGKTITAAKIASEQMLHYKRKVALITVDSYRITAVEQLKTYAKIINVPLSIVSDKAELDRAIATYADYDSIIIDTGGCSQRDESQMFDLREIFDERGRIHNILVLSTTTKDSDLNEITRKFGCMPIDSVIFTKLDESATYGSIFNHVIRFKKPISFLTTGQKVPEDIEMATKERLVDLLLHISGT